MAGIPDVLTDIRTTGQGVPMGGQPPIGGGQPPMMNQGLASMGSGQPTMPPVVDDQMSMPPMGGQEMPSEQPQEMSIEQDGVMLAEATMGRTGGDTQAAVAILDTAKAVLISGGQEEPMMMKDGGPLYAQDGMPLMNTVSMINDTIDSLDTDTLKQMIADNLRENPVLNSEGAYNITSPMGTNVRTAVSQLSNDVLGRDVSDNRTQEAANAAIAYQMSLR